MSKSILYSMTLVLLTASVVMAMDAYTTYQILRKPVSPLVPTVEKVPVEPVDRSTQKKDYSVIVRRNLFATASLNPAPVVKQPPKEAVRAKKAVQPPKKVEEPLTLDLVGTTVGPEGSRYAILADRRSRTQTIHSVGDSVQGALIQSVERSEIRLLRNGKITVLRAFDEGSQKGGVQHSSLRRPVPSFRPAPPGEQIRKLRRQLIRSRLLKLAEGNNGLEGQIRAVPYEGKNGELGVRVFPSGRGRLIQQLGLRGGDIIFEINGSPVADKFELYAAIANILNQDETMVRIFRRGKPYEIFYRIR